MNKYESHSLAKIQNSIKRKNDLIERFQAMEVTEDKDLSVKIQAEEAELDLLLEALEKKEQKPIVPNETANQSYARATKIMEVDAALKHVKKLGPGVSAEDFLENLNQKYQIFIKPQLNEFPYLENEFVKRCLNALNSVYLAQILNAGEQIDDFETFKAYVSKHYGTKRSNFQVLNDCFSLQPHDGESYTDFAARLDISIRKAATRIIARHKASKTTTENPDPVVSPNVVFELTGALLMAQMVQKTNKPIYDLMCRKMDEYEDPIRVGAEAQKLYDRGVRGDGNIEIINYGNGGTTGNGGIAGNGGMTGHGGITGNSGGNSNQGASHGRRNGNNRGRRNGRNGKTGGNNRNNHAGKDVTNKTTSKTDDLCRYTTKNCFRYAKGECKRRHSDETAHVVNEVGDTNSNAYNGYTYSDFRQ